VIHREDVRQAAERIAGRVRRTPAFMVEPAAYDTPAPVLLKLEQTQHTGSFKARGAFNRLLVAMERKEMPAAGVLAASGGNHGLAVAYAAKRLEVPAEIFVPIATPRMKLERLHSMGAIVRQVGGAYADAFHAASERQAEIGALLCHAYDDGAVCAGQGTLGLELLEQAGELGRQVDTVLVAVGGGGLLAGMLAAIDGSARVVAVEPVAAPTLHDALVSGRPVDVSVSGVTADSLGARRIGDIAFELATRDRVASVLVDDSAIIAARRALWQRCHLAVEHGAATALAALASGAYLPESGERAAVVVCGGNTDLADLALS
jgi:threonine dehydratase